VNDFKESRHEARLLPAWVGKSILIGRPAEQNNARKRNDLKRRPPGARRVAQRQLELRR
jgi:hypothetical protein